MPKTKRQFVVATGLKQRKRMLQTLPGVDELSGKPISDSIDAMRHDSFGQIVPPLDVAQHGGCMRSHGAQLAPHITPDPEAEINREPVRGAGFAGRGLASFDERLCRFRRP